MPPPLSSGVSEPPLRPFGPRCLVSAFGFFTFCQAHRGSARMIFRYTGFFFPARTSTVGFFPPAYAAR